MSALIYYMLVPLINNNIMGLITINCLSDAATLTGDESFLLYQNCSHIRVIYHLFIG